MWTGTADIDQRVHQRNWLLYVIYYEPAEDKEVVIGKWLYGTIYATTASGSIGIPESRVRRFNSYQRPRTKATHWSLVT